MKHVERCDQQKKHKIQNTHKNEVTDLEIEIIENQVFTLKYEVEENSEGKT